MIRQQYHPITKDEVNYWFDILQDKSIYNIAKITGIKKTKVSEILDERFKHDLRFVYKG